MLMLAPSYYQIALYSTIRFLWRYFSKKTKFRFTKIKEIDVVAKRKTNRVNLTLGVSVRLTERSILKHIAEAN